MKQIAKIASLIGLGATIAPCLLYYAELIGHDAVKWTALIGTIVWFAATPVWMGRELPVDAAEVEI